MPGPTISGLRIADPPRRWAALGFAVEASACRIGSVELELGADGEGLVGWTLTGDGPASIDGISTGYGSLPDGAAPQHPNGALRLDHVVLLTSSAERTYAALEALGMRLRRERSGVGPDGRSRQGFFRDGEVIIEVVGPAAAAEPSKDPARLEPGKDPARLWGAVVVVSDLDALAVRLGEQLGRARSAVQPGRRIAPVRSSAGLGAALAFMTE